MKTLKPGETMVLDVTPGKGEALTPEKVKFFQAVYDRDVGIH